MTKTNVLICDDSAFARKQMARAVPDGWEVDIHFAVNGMNAIEQIHQGNGDVMFLDLNMPVMDGYQTMEIIRKEDLPCLVIVVSGDVQPEARQRMLAKGALDFIRKPIDNDKLSTLLKQYGIYTGDSAATQRTLQAAISPASETEMFDAFREVVNVAMGRAGENLARLLNEFIDLPIPNVNVIENNELHMAIAEINRNESVSAVSKGFVSAGIHGEALVLFNDTEFASIIELLNYHQLSAAPAQLEALMDISNIIIGACLNGLSEQLNVTFSHSSPIILGRNRELESILTTTRQRWSRIVAVEVCFAIKHKGVNFDLLLLFPEKSMERIYSRLVGTEG
ncbi:response regulator [Alteromonas gilva]|uniref:Response regulator n=1 Tax=Alteromonas gilva TaxID=2987522 RepID=A0ABT5L7S2_9ALTE|nr:response regulator [Alteromonas gilva]MDC8833084.1 response regulator [Alteromonas gilva]